MNMKFKLWSKKEESIAEKVVDAAFTVYKVKVLGSGLLEKSATTSRAGGMSEAPQRARGAMLCW